MKPNDNFWVGLMIGATVPVIGFWLLEQIFVLLTEMNLIDEVNAFSSIKRQRTTALLAIACNLPFIQILKKRRYDKLIKGVLIAMFIYCGFWLVYYYGSLFG